jgi:hypothetical protein
MSIFLPSQDENVRKKRGWRAALIVGVVLIVIVGWRPVRDGFRRAHGRKLAAEAQAYAAQNRAEAALASANQAVRKGEKSVATLRLLLDLSARLGRPEAFSYWAVLAKHADLTLADRRELFRWALTWGQIEAAEMQWVELMKEKALPHATARLAAHYFELRGDAERAVAFARQTLEADSNDVETRILLGRVLLKDGAPRDRAIGKRLLMEQAEREGQIGLTVLRQLAASRELLPFEATECARWLEARRSREVVDDLTLADLQWQAKPYLKERVIRETAAKFQGPADLLARWLVGHERFADVIDALPFEKAAKSHELSMFHCDALAMLGKWEEIENRLADGSGSIKPLERALYRARAATELKQTRVAELQWAQALDHAGKDPRSLLLLAGYAKASRAWGVAETALRALAIQKPFSQRALRELVLLFEFQGERSKVRSALTELLQAYPDDLSAQNDLAYLQLLEGAEIAAARRTAEKLVRSKPDYLSFRSTLALAHLREGESQSARVLFDERTIDWTRTAPAQKAVYAAVLGNTGDAVKARELCRTITLDSLRPEEKVLIESWL